MYCRSTGKLVGDYVNSKYKNIDVNGIKYRTHRIIWKLLKGYDPIILDHINRNKLDNRIENLREASNSLNVINVDDERYLNKSGRRCINKHGNKYRSRISVNNKRIHLGLFKTIEEAEQAYKIAYKEYYERP